MQVGFDHVTLVVDDVGEAEEFLGVLGFRRDKEVVVSGDTFADYMGLPGFQADHVTFVLEGCPLRQEVQLLRFHHPHPQAADMPGYLGSMGFNHVCFRVDDLDATLERFAALGHKPRNSVLDFHDRRLVFLDGPGGVVFELAEWKVAPTPPVTGA
jgi:catechol 2,3-dioxygenase-like lactoylglutathione lyase family enzyme